eukprot:7895342-Prorocentrum_lima.AAC.1
MTSSLVGSEMCIRDRSAGVCAHAHVCVGLPVCVRGLCITDRHRQRNTGAVSYTHLTLPTICSV